MSSVNSSESAPVKKNRQGAFKIFVILVILAAAGIASFLAAYHITTNRNGLDVRVLSMGDGKCTLLRAGTGVVVIDCGTEESVPVLLDYLHENNIRSIDALILTSDDARCIGGAAELVSNVHIEDLVTPDFGDHPSRTWLDAHETAMKEDITMNVIDEDSAFILQNASYLLLPVSDRESSSLLVSIMYGKSSLLYTGCASDAQIESHLSTEMAMTHDVLFLPGNGEMADHLPELFATVKPSLVAVSCGTEDTVSQETRDLIAAQRAKLLPTADADIHLFTAGKTFKVK